VPLPGIIIGLCFFASPVLAEEVLDCTDTAVVGFKWDNKGVASPIGFEPNRYTIKVVSDSKRLITLMARAYGTCTGF
jgi:hypothetical protein